MDRYKIEGTSTLRFQAASERIGANGGRSWRNKRIR